MPFDTRFAVATEVAPDAEFLAIPFGPDLDLRLDPALDLELDLPVPPAAILAHYQVKGEAGDLVEVPVAGSGRVRRVLLYAVGDNPRKAGAALAGKAKGRERLTVLVPAGNSSGGNSGGNSSAGEGSSGSTAALVEGALLATYAFTIGAAKGKAVEEIVFVGGDPAELQRGAAMARATAVARDLVNMPASVKTPAWLAAEAVRIGTAAGLTVRVDTELRGFGGIKAVGQGSASPPCLVEIAYTPATYDRHVVLVGKGITFDSGGLSLKPAEGMKTMKTDMAGGAAVIAAMGALAEFEVPVRVTGLIACAENAFSGSAQRPSDVIVQYGGRTVEVLNTDAEGRLVLADALAYADAELDPDALVDIATLTGAAKVALGTGYGALFATDEALARELLAAGEGSGDRLWRMPLVEEYLDDLHSDIADLANVDRRMSGAAGSVAAALFLREFTGKRPWAHLDIAGPARGEKGATGFGVRLLLDWLSG